MSSSGLWAFQSAKSCGLSLTAALSGTSSSPWSISSSERFESLPYSGKLATRKYTSPPVA